MTTGWSARANIGVGLGALKNITNAEQNVAIWVNALLWGSTFYNTTAIGDGAGAYFSLDPWSNNTYIGAKSHPTVWGLSNATAIWYNAIVSTSNTVILGEWANVGIGTTTPTQKLDVNGYASIGNPYYSYLYMKDDESTAWPKSIHANSNVIWFLGWQGSWLAYWDYAGNQYNTAAITATQFLYSSDRRLKQNIVPLSNSLDKILSLSGYSFDWIKDGKHDIGVIAQEVEKVFPELVHEWDDTNGKKFKSVQYGNLIAPVIEAIKELAINLKNNTTEINILKSENEALKKRLDAIEARLAK